MIVVEQLSKRYADAAAPALQDVSLTVNDGSIFGIIGKSGAGKSTLIRCLNLLERPTTGRILLDGQDLTLLNEQQLRQQRQRIGMIFQNFNLLHARNVSDNIAVPLQIAGIGRDQRKKRVAELLDLVGLSDKARAFPSQLSGGQKQRVGIARALAAHPHYLLSDEATSALDAETTASILALLRDINRQLGLTIVLITHELEVVKSICDSAALLAKGRVLESGPLQQLISAPGSLLGQALLPDCGGNQETGVIPVAELTFFDSLLASPVLSALARQHAVGVTLFGGGIASIAGQRVGRLRVGFTPPPGGVDLREVMQFLNQNGVKAEWV